MLRELILPQSEVIRAIFWSTVHGREQREVVVDEMHRADRRRVSAYSCSTDSQQGLQLYGLQLQYGFSIGDLQL